MRFWIFTKRNLIELIRDPLTWIFSFGLPLMLLTIMSIINKAMPIEIFTISRLTPGIIIMSFSFITLFGGNLVSKDRSTSFLTRLYASPLTSVDYIAGYSIPFFIMSLIQIIIAFVFALFLGLEFSINILYSIIFLIPTSIFFIAVGILMGCILSDKQAGPLSSVNVTLATLLSGMYFDLKLIGGVFESVAYILPYAHAYDIGIVCLYGQINEVWSHLCWTVAYALAFFVLAVYVFKRKMKQ